MAFTDRLIFSHASGMVVDDVDDVDDVDVGRVAGGGWPRSFIGLFEKGRLLALPCRDAALLGGRWIPAFRSGLR